MLLQQPKSIAQLIVFCEKLPQPEAPAGRKDRILPYHMEAGAWISYLRDVLGYNRVLAERSGMKFPWKQYVRLRLWIFIARGNRSGPNPLGASMAHSSRHNTGNLAALLAVALVCSGYIEHAAQIIQAECGKFWTLPASEYEDDDTYASPATPIQFAHRHGGMVLELRTLDEQDVRILMLGQAIQQACPGS